jgi:hypothetical protein
LLHNAELLNGEIFTTLREAQIILRGWRQHYNRVRPHSSPIDHADRARCWRANDHTCRRQNNAEVRALTAMAAQLLCRSAVGPCWFAEADTSLTKIAAPTMSIKKWRLNAVCARAKAYSN